MNYAILFLVPSTLANTSYDVRKIAFTTMGTKVITDALKKQYPNSTAHWYDAYRIGGLWSGYFSRLFLEENKLQSFIDEVEQTYGWPVVTTVLDVDSTTHEKRQKSLEIFLKYFPDFQGELPFFRHEFLNRGNLDDALFIDDKNKYATLLQEYEGKSVVASTIRGINLFNLSGLEVSPENIIGSHWVVIVACHF